MESLAKKNLSFSISILICIFLFQLLKAYLFHDMYYTLEYVFSALGGFFVLIGIPLLTAIIAKLVLKKLFFGVLWKLLLIIAIPISLISFYGAYHENSQKKDSRLQSNITPKKYEPSPSELEDFEAKIHSQTFLTMDQINDAIKRSPTNAINYYNRGILYSWDLNHSKAIQDYSRAIELDLNLAVAYLNRSTEYLFLNDLDKALADCSKAIQLNPNLSEAFFNRAKIKVHLGKSEESLNDMKHAARLGNSESIRILRKNNIDWNE